MKINLLCISKERSSSAEISEFKDKILSFGVKFECIEIFNSKISQAQKIADSENFASIKAVQNAYSKAFEPFLNFSKMQSLNIALSPNGKSLDSENFAHLLRDKQEVSFFIGGAYGFGTEFLKLFQKYSNAKILSLSALTMNHKIAKIVLTEQIYRALSIINNHPYHK